LDLLASICLIAIFLGLLIPAINSSKGPARTNQCATNMRNVALAAIEHDSSKGSFPAYIQDFGTYQGQGIDPSDPTNLGVPDHKKIGTWAVAILPWLDGQPTYEHWTQDRYPILVADPNNPPALGTTTGLAGHGFHTLASPNFAIFQCVTILREIQNLVVTA
jgi:type II secretory pathway pseudopilin PulG